MQDVGGNVWEWTNTCFLRFTLDPTGAARVVNTNCGVRVVQGAHRTYMTDFIRDPRTGGCAAGVPPANLGFRLVVEDEKLPMVNRIVERAVAQTWRRLLNRSVSAERTGASPMNIDPQVKYREERLPRYTSLSYRTAFFAGHVRTPIRRLASIAGSESEQPLSTFMYRSCRSMCWHRGCHTTITKHDTPILTTSRSCGGRSRFAPGGSLHLP